MRTNTPPAKKIQTKQKQNQKLRRINPNFPAKTTNLLYFYLNLSVGVGKTMGNNKKITVLKECNSVSGVCNVFYYYCSLFLFFGLFLEGNV